MKQTNHLFRILFQCAVFLIPSNLAYHWYTQSAYIHGRLIDYLLPRLYLSDLPVLGVIIIYVFIKRFNIFKSIISHINLYLIPYLVFLIYLWYQKTLMLSPDFMWAIGKCIEWFLFFVAIYSSYTKKQFLKDIRFPLLTSMTIQIVVSFYQFINQSSLFGYIFMGEPSLESVGIVKNSYFGLLEVTPYGTTPHPNVLAGYLCVGFFLIRLCSQFKLTSLIKKSIYWLFIGLLIALLYLTQSQAVWISFFIGNGIISLKKRVSNRNMTVIVLILSASSLILSPLFLSLLYHMPQSQNNHSITARYELNTIAIHLWHNHPVFGVGLNQFIRQLPQTPLTGQKTLFLQPPHHIVLLILSETGLIGIGICLLIFNWYKNKLKMRHPKASYLVPCMVICFIGSFDHYPFTLQTGQILLILSSVLPLLKD